MNKAPPQVLVSVCLLDPMPPYYDGYAPRYLVDQWRTKHE